MRRPSPPAEGEAQTGPLILYSLLTGGLAGGAALLASLALKAVEARVGGLLGYLPPGPPGEGGLGQAFTGPSSPLLPLLLHRLDPKKLQEALHQVFPEADLGGVLVVDGKHLRGSGKGKSPQVRLVEVLALHLKTTLAQARVEGKVVEKGGHTSSF